MMTQAENTPPRTGHVPVLLDSIIQKISPVSGIWVDGTFGAGGYSRALLRAGAEQVIAIDRDPNVLAKAREWLPVDAQDIRLFEGRFGELDQIVADSGTTKVAGVVLDIGVSSMQLDTATRGFSFMRDGPLDMRMEGDGPTAADLVASLPERDLADLLFLYGEERASRRIASRIVAARLDQPITRTLQLADIIAGCLPRPRPGQPHAATRSFQALRIAVNDELGELVRGLAAAERALLEGGLLAVVTFHSLEDRIVKRFIQARSGVAARGSRHAPEGAVLEPAFERVTRKAIAPDAEENEANPRARSAKLRVARRLSAPSEEIDPHSLGLPAYRSLIYGGTR